MADNYLERKLEEHNALEYHKTSKPKTNLSIDSLLLKNRSYRGFDHSRIVTEEELDQIIGVNNKIPSANNQQVLRFRPIIAQQAAELTKLIRLGGALPELHLPLLGTEPKAYIIVCSTIEEGRYVDIDLGISAQSMLLKAISMGLNGICIGAFNREKVKELFSLPLEPILILAIGKGSEKIQILPINASESHKYYRKEGIHYVPKIRLEDLYI